MEGDSSAIKPSFESTIHLKCKDPDDEAMRKIAELRQLISPNPLYTRYSKFCSDKQLMLFLTAKSFNMKEAKKLVEEALKWRASRDVEKLVGKKSFPRKLKRGKYISLDSISGVAQL